MPCIVVPDVGMGIVCGIYPRQRHSRYTPAWSRDDVGSLQDTIAEILVATDARIR